MANNMYTSAVQKFLEGSIDYDADTIKCVLIDSADYTANFTTHDFLDDVAAGARVGTPQTLAGKTTTNGVADANDVTFTAVTGDPCEKILVWKDTGTESTSALICLLDCVVTPNGGDITVRWHATDGVFKFVPV